MIEFLDIDDLREFIVACCMCMLRASRVSRVLMLGLVGMVLCAGCAAVETGFIKINAVGGSPSPSIQTVRCAAQQSGWTITFSDDQNLSGTKTIGMDNVPLSLNVGIQTEDGSALKASVSVNSPRGGSIAREYQREFIEAFTRCGASADVIVTTP